MRFSITFRITATLLLAVLLALWLGSAFSDYLPTILPESIVSALAANFPTLSILLILATPLIIAFIIRSTKART